MNPTHLCPECHAALPANAPQGLCPQCLLKAAAGSPSGDIIDIGDPAEVAKKLPQFEILELLGRGGMGVVYKARQLQLDRLVALKILPPVDALSADFVARFTREARALAKLNHPNIVNVYDFGETGGLYWIIMEYVEGANLRQLLEARKLTPAEALAIVPKICDALQYAHEEGLVHRDIKPENLLIDKKGRVKIADFGLAKLLRREPLDMTLTLSGMALGTLRYMAPEQMDKPETVDHRADLYSLGVVIYEMLTGETPVGRFELPSQKAQVDVRFDEIVLHALEREPARRYQHASEVRDDVEKVTSKPQVAQVPKRDAPVAPITAPEPEAHAIGSFLRAILWLVVLIGAVMFGWFEIVDGLSEIDPTVRVESVRIGVVQPWLILMDLSSGHSFYRLNLATVSALGGLCALVAGIALFCFRRRSATDVRREVRRAAIGLLVSGIAGAVMAFAFTMMLINEGQWDKRFAGCIVGVVLCVTFAVLAAFVFRGALKMLHCEDYVASRRAALCSIFSFNIVSLPVGIWALVKLSRPEVKAAFAQPEVADQPSPPACPRSPRHLLSAFLALLFLFGVWFGLSFQAKHAGTAAGLTKIITVGALDPLFTSESGPSGFQTGFNFFSWSFFAVVVAGVAFGALWRIGREDQGKVPRDPAWWRDWWKQVGVWGGLLLTVCIVRTVMDPAKVLQPPGNRSVSAKFAGRLEPAPVPALGTITDGVGAEFTVPAGQVAIFEIVTRKNGATVALPNLAAYVIAPTEQALKGTFRWSREPVDFSSGTRRQPWRIEVRTSGDGKASSGGLDLPEALEPEVGSMSLGLGLEPAHEDIHWTGPDKDNLPSDGGVGLRVRTLAHGIKAGMPGSAGWSGAASIDWKKSAPPQPPREAVSVPTQPFMIGLTGPELTNDAVKKLKLSKLQTDEINRIVMAYHREYLALQRRHSKVGKDDAGRIVVTIAPFYDECLALANRLQTELGGIVDPALLPVMKDGELPFQIFNWGGAFNETVTMWRADGKYHVEEKLTSSPGHERDPFTDNISGPKLEEIPESFRIFWREN